MANVFPSGLFNVSSVDVRVVRGRYVPCRSCHWFGQCVVPKGSYLPKFKEYYGTGDIMYHDGYGRGPYNSIVYHCEEYTVLK